MSAALLVPSLIITHDDVGSKVADRIGWIASRTPRQAVISECHSFDPDILSGMLAGVGAAAPFVIVHVVGPMVDPARGIHSADAEGRIEAFVSQIQEISTKVLDRYPALQNLRQWVIHAVGQALDEDEVHLIERVLESTSADTSQRNHLRGVLVTATSTQTSVNHSVEEQQGFCADAALMLCGTSLEIELGEAPTLVWAVGCSSVSYDNGELAASLTALVATEFLSDRLLAAAPPGDSGRETGEEWLLEFGLSGDGEEARYLESPRGGSLRSRVRLERPDFDALPIRSWSDALTTTHAITWKQEVPVVRSRITENAGARLAELKDRIFAETLDHAERTANLESTIRYSEGVRDAIGRELLTLRAAEPEFDYEDLGQLRTSFREFLRWMPFGSAVALRVLMLSLTALVVIGAAVPAEIDRVLLRGVDRPWARLVAAAILILGFVLYQRRLARTFTARDRYRHALDRQLQHGIDEHVHAERIRVLEQLRSWLGPSSAPLPATSAGEEVSMITWWQHLAAGCRSVSSSLDQQASQRNGLIGWSSQFAVDLPLPADMSTGAIHKEVIRKSAVRVEDLALAFASWLGREHRASSLRATESNRLLDFWRSWNIAAFRPVVWRSLADLLGQPSTMRRARSAVEADLTPAVEMDGAVRSNGRPLHYLAVPEGEGSDVHRKLFPELFGGSHDLDQSHSRISRELDGVIATCDADSVFMIHLMGLDIGIDQTPVTGSSRSEDEETA